MKSALTGMEIRILVLTGPVPGPLPLAPSI